MKTTKRTIAILLALLMVLALAACGSSGAPAASAAAVSAAAAGSAPASPAGTGKSSVLVAYFSATGTTKGVAEKLAQAAGADLYEIVPAEPYTRADLDYSDSRSRTTLEMNDAAARPKIAGDAVSLEGYDVIFVGYPIWWGAAPRIMSTFVESCNFGGKTVIPFCTSGSSDIGSSGDELAKQAAGGNWLSGRRFDGSTSAADLTAWLKDLGLG